MKKLMILFMVLLVVFSFGCKKEVVQEQPEIPTETIETTMTETAEDMTPAAETTEADTTEVVDERLSDTTEILIYQGIEVDPFELTVKVGQEVTWTNMPEIGKKSRKFQIIGDKQDPFESDLLDVGESFTHTYTKAGTYQYVIAPGSAGKVIVVE